jgi:hypothetical protein
MIDLVLVDSKDQEYERVNGNCHYEKIDIPTYSWKITKKWSKLVPIFGPCLDTFGSLSSYNQPYFQMKHVIYSH